MDARSSCSLRPSFFFVLAVMLAVLAGCARKPEPSPDYAQARQIFNRLYAQDPDDAFIDPEMEDVERLLRVVPAESADGTAARELLARIAGERERVRAERARLEEALAEARTVPQFPRSAEPPPAPSPAQPAPDVPDAGADAEPSQPEAGMPVSVLTTRFSRCFRQGQTLLVTGRGMRETWEMRDTANCRDLHPGFDSKLLIIEDGKIWGHGEKSTVRPTLLDGGTPPPAAPPAEAPAAAQGP